jgi:hypothetical protein
MKPPIWSDSPSRRAAAGILEADGQLSCLSIFARVQAVDGREPSRDTAQPDILRAQPGRKANGEAKRLSALVRPSSELIAAVLLITALIGGKALADTPQTNRMNAAIGEVDAAIAKDAAFFVRIQAELLSYDRVLQMRMARGAIAGQETQRLLQQRAEDLVKGTVGGAAGVAEEREEAKLFFASIENAASRSVAAWSICGAPSTPRAKCSTCWSRAEGTSVPR